LVVEITYATTPKWRISAGCPRSRGVADSAAVTAAVAWRRPLPKEAPVARTARSLVRLAALGAAVATAGGCALVDPQQADDLYAAPSEGVQVELTEQVRAENLLVVAEEEGGEGRLSGALVNDTAQDVRFVVVVAGEQLDVEVPARGTVLLGVDEPADVAVVPAAPGSLAEVTLATTSQGAVTAGIPVLDGTLPHYADFLD
jgi:hypothetical protein